MRKSMARAQQRGTAVTGYQMISEAHGHLEVAREMRVQWEIAMLSAVRLAALGNDDLIRSGLDPVNFHGQLGGTDPSELAVSYEGLPTRLARALSHARKLANQIDGGNRPLWGDDEDDLDDDDPDDD